MGPNNQYEAALWQVGSVVEPYDFDKMFPVFGFGGVPTHMGIHQVSHCFPVNGNPENPEVFGIAGVVETYKRTIASINLNGPTNFATLLEQFKQLCQRNKDQKQMVYQILLICTDGQITDMQFTID